MLTHKTQSGADEIISSAVVIPTEKIVRYGQYQYLHSMIKYSHTDHMIPNVKALLALLKLALN